MAGNVQEWENIWCNFCSLFSGVYSLYEFHSHMASCSVCDCKRVTGLAVKQISKVNFTHPISTRGMFVLWK